MKLEVNAAWFDLSREQLDDISKFHRTLLLDILKVVPECFAYDNEGESNGYFVVPLKPSKHWRSEWNSSMFLFH